MKKNSYSLKLKYNIGKIICALIIISGCVLILITLFMNIFSVFTNKKEVIEFRKNIENMQQQKEQTKDYDNKKLNIKIKDETVAILQIPPIKCEEVVKDGSDKATLSKALGHMENTVYPGQLGNCVIAGHRNYNFGLFFNRLDEVKINDEIILETEEATYTYQVTGTKVVEPDDLAVLDQTEEATLTLITCTPIYIATHRLIVNGVLVKTDKKL